MKCCIKCKLNKAETSFYYAKGRPDGLESSCKECKSAYIKYRWANDQDYRNRKYYKDKYSKEQRYHKCNKCNNSFTTSTAPNRTGMCRVCSKVEISKIWTKNNLHIKAIHRASRRAAKLQRTPNWLSKEQKDKIAAYYRMARWLSLILNQKIEVDHIMPLQGKTFSGLHVPWNLQLLTKKQNCSKGNK